MAINLPPPSSTSVAIHAMKQRSNSLGSSLSNTRPNVSCDGMPLRRSRNVLSQSNFRRPYSATSTHPSAPAITAKTAMVLTSLSRCRRLCRRGSGISYIWRSIFAVAWASMPSSFPLLEDCSRTTRSFATDGRTLPLAVPWRKRNFMICRRRHGYMRLPWGRASGERLRRDGAPLVASGADGLAAAPAGAGPQGPQLPQETAENPPAFGEPAGGRDRRFPGRSGHQHQSQNRLHVDAQRAAG